jgi:homoserine kinase
MSSEMSVRVPASSANLGPGFDTLGLALNIHLHCHARRGGRLHISAQGRDIDRIPTDETNLIWRTSAKVAALHRREMPAVSIEINNEIPVGKGLGSSAAALVAGVAIADRILDLGWDEHRILDEAARLEGHPDNVAACVLGSLTTATIGSDGVTRAVRLEIPAWFSLAVVCPDFELPTEKMRAVLPDCYSAKDVVFNLQRATLFLAALATSNRDAFPAALEDRLHQPYRASHVPGMAEILKLRAPGLLGCALSGAGPAMLVFFEKGFEPVVDRVQEEVKRAGRSSQVWFPRIDQEGLRIS